MHLIPFTKFGQVYQLIHLLCTLLAEATPKAIMKIMAVRGLTLYHLKSHLQVLPSFNI